MASDGLDTTGCWPIYNKSGKLDSPPGAYRGRVAVAYEHPLGSHSIREAYFLGRRNDDKLAAFLAQYMKLLPVPKSGPHVPQIEIRTPPTRYL
jgi:hypothetical protein